MFHKDRHGRPLGVVVRVPLHLLATETQFLQTILVQFYNAQGINGNGDDAGGGDDDDGENDGDDDDAENNGDDDDDDGDSENDSGDDDDILHFTLQLPLETIY